MGKARVLVMGLAALLVVMTSMPSQAQLFGKRNDDSAFRLNEMEERLRRLTGQIEQLTYQLREMQEQMRRMQEDNEYRFQQLESAPNGKRSDLAPSGNSTAQAGSTGIMGTLPVDGSGDGNWDQTGGYQDGTGGETTGGPIDLSALANGQINPGGSNALRSVAPEQTVPDTGDQIAGLIATGNPRTDYDSAYGLAVNGDYQGAENGFRAFLSNYPGHQLSSNAQYWLGESLLAQNNYRDAADAFLKTYTDHPNSSKSADSLLKLGVSLRGLGEIDAACATFTELLNKFPNAAPALLLQARDEQRRANCA